MTREKGENKGEKMTDKRMEKMKWKNKIKKEENTQIKKIKIKEKEKDCTVQGKVTRRKR